jgi:hypothetical protein
VDALQGAAVVTNLALAYNHCWVVLVDRLSATALGNRPRLGLFCAVRLVRVCVIGSTQLLRP